MVQLIKPLTTKVITKDGECHLAISLELTINLNSDGLLVSADNAKTKVASKNQNKEDDNPIDMIIPDFSSGNKVKFGKNV